MEKGTPTYDLKLIRMLVEQERVAVTYSARCTLFALGGMEEDLFELLNELDRKSFYKSMTSYADHRQWQDVYHPIWRGRECYLKFLIDDDGCLVLSFKER